MAVDKAASDPKAKDSQQVHDARYLLRTAFKGSLATLDHETGHPYVSLVLVATEPDGTPLLLLSGLARHGKNLRKDARASLLLDGTGGRDEPLTGNRVTVIGKVLPSTSPTARRRFLARHSSASEYVDFGDFSMFSLKVANAHFIGGFGRIFSLPGAALLTKVEDATALIEAEPEIVTHMNSDHTDAVALYATKLLGLLPGDWRMSGIDPDGADLLQRTTTARIAFAERVKTPPEARAMLVALARQAREHPSA